MGNFEQLRFQKKRGIEFDSFKNVAGSNAFTLSPQKWINATNAIIQKNIDKLGEIRILIVTDPVGPLHCFGNECINTTGLLFFEPFNYKNICKLSFLFSFIQSAEFSTFNVTSQVTNFPVTLAI